MPMLELHTAPALSRLCGFLKLKQDVLGVLFPKRFNGVSRKFKGCLKFQGCFKEVSRVFQRSFKGVCRKFQGCFKEVSRVFQLRFQGISSSFKRVSRVF